MKEEIQNPTSFDQVENLLFPFVQPGSESVLPAFEQALNLIKRIDLMQIDDQTLLETNINIAQDWLNKICRDYHRIQLISVVIKKSFSFSHNLKGLPVARQHPIISNWHNQLRVKKMAEHLDQFPNPIKNKLNEVLDDEFFRHRRISYMTRILISYPNVVISRKMFEEAMKDDNHPSDLPISHIFFIGIIAASTFGCRYLWNRLVENFIMFNGDLAWLQEGIQSKKVPVLFKKLSQISCHLALNSKRLLTSEILQDLGDFGVEQSQILRAFVALAYYQTLACFCLSHGLLPETKHNQEYLPLNNFLGPSMESFYQMQKILQVNEEQQKQKGEQFTFQNTWPEEDEEKQNSSAKSNEDLNPIEKTLKQTNLLEVIEQQQNSLTSKNFKSVENLRQIYGKFVHFCKNCFMEFEQKTAQEKKKKFTKKLFFKEENYILSSEWNFNQNVYPILEACLGENLSISIKKLLKSMRSMNHKKSKDIQDYLHSFHNYMHEHVDYIKLMKEKLTPDEKQFIKLVTKSPFLFATESFEKLKKDLNRDEMTEYILEILSHKFEFDMVLLTLIYDRYFFE